MPPKRKAPRGRPTSVVHEVAGEFNGSGRISCILCGKVIVDYSDAQFEFNGTPTKGSEAERAFPPGPVTLVMGGRSGESHHCEVRRRLRGEAVLGTVTRLSLKTTREPYAAHLRQY